MNNFLACVLSLNLLFSSLAIPTGLFAVSPNPFSNTSIKYDFDSPNEAATYYYMQLKNNSISYSDSDILTLLCVLANIYVQDKDSLSSDMISNIQYYYELDVPELQWWIQHDLSFYNMLGYIVKPSSSFFSKAGKWLYNYWLTMFGTTPSVQEFPHIYYFAYLYDNITFDRYTIEPSTSLINDIEGSANSVQNVPYTMYSSFPVSNLTNFYTSSLFYNRTIYESFLSDLDTVSSTYNDFVFLPLYNDYFFPHLSTSHSGSQNPSISSFSTSLITGYIFGFTTVSGAYIKAGSTGNGFIYDLYDSNWNKLTFSYEFLAKYLDSSVNLSSDLSSVKSIVFYSDSYDYDRYYDFIWFDYDSSFIPNRTIYPYCLFQSFSNFCNTFYTGNLSSSFVTRQYDYPFLVAYHFSANGFSIPLFNSLADFQSYSLSNGLFFKATEVNNTSVSYETYNNYTSLVDSNNTTYNSVNNYVTDNSITTIDNSTQTIINNYFNFDIEFNFDIVINNIKHVEGSESDYINSFQQYFNDSGYKDFSFTSWSSESNGESSTFGQFSPVITLLNVFYNNLPSKLQMVLAGVFAVGLFGMILGVASRIVKSKGE